jgi:hypothetical protein
MDALEGLQLYLHAEGFSLNLQGRSLQVVYNGEARYLLWLVGDLLYIVGDAQQGKKVLENATEPTCFVLSDPNSLPAIAKCLKELLWGSPRLRK